MKGPHSPPRREGLFGPTTKFSSPGMSRETDHGESNVSEPFDDPACGEGQPRSEIELNYRQLECEGRSLDDRRKCSRPGNLPPGVD